MQAAVEYVELMERLDFEDFKVSIKSTSVPNAIASNRLLAERIDYPLHIPSPVKDQVVRIAQVREWGSARCWRTASATRSISLSTFHAEEEVKVAWEVLKAPAARARPVLIACSTCGRLQFDMDTVVAEIEQRLVRAADRGGRARLCGQRHRRGLARDFGITGAKNEGLIFAHGKPLEGPAGAARGQLLFAEIDKSLAVGDVVVDEHKAAEGRSGSSGSRRTPAR